MAIKVLKLGAAHNRASDAAAGENNPAENLWLRCHGETPTPSGKPFGREKGE